MNYKKMLYVGIECDEFVYGGEYWVDLLGGSDWVVAWGEDDQKHLLSVYNFREL